MLSPEDEGRVFACDVAVVGAGVAGQYLAEELAKAGRSVLILESGGRDFDPQTQALADGDNAGLDYYPLDHARLRFFGGTTAVWGGRICRLDPIDFERRDWVPLSGWPFGAEALERYYNLAEASLGFRPIGETALRPFRLAPVLDARTIDTRFWRFDPEVDRFTAARRAALTSHPRIEVLTHATVLRIGLAADGGSVERLDIATLEGVRAQVHARHVVLAAGGLENARLLLLSNDVMPMGVGNGSGWVGRCFMEHPHGRAATVTSRRPATLLALSTFLRNAGELAMPSLRPSEALQRKRQGLNTSFTIVARKAAGTSPTLIDQSFRVARDNFASPTGGWRRAFMALRDSSRVAQLALDPWRPAWMVRAGLRELTMIVRAEQVPNPDSRVLLSDARDAFGQRRLALDWRMNALDKHGVSVAIETLDGELRRLGLGSARPCDWVSDPTRAWQFDPVIGKHWIGGFHHMGTTRMAASPAQGVCDGDGRVHGIANLHVAGSSLFPTGGWANPTLTIMALALRQAEHLAGR